MIKVKHASFMPRCALFKGLASLPLSAYSPTSTLVTIILLLLFQGGITIHKKNRINTSKANSMTQLCSCILRKEWNSFGMLTSLECPNNFTVFVNHFINTLWKKCIAKVTFESAGMQ